MGKQDKLSGKVKSRSFPKLCEKCGDKFFSTKKGIFCTRRCMYEWRKDNNWITTVCLECKNKFRHRKNERHHRSGKKRMFCSNECSRSSDYKKELTRQQWLLNNPMDNIKSKEKIKQTKFIRYGDSNYNNLKKQSETTMKKYGVPYTILLGKSNGKRISNVQRKIYEQILEKFSDAKLEAWLSDVKKSVDIFIPSQNKIIEVFGNYWHCNPQKYSPNYFNKSIKLTAQEIWNKDRNRIIELKSYGYNVEIIWEN